MRAVTVADIGVQILDVDMPKPKSNDVLVKAVSYTHLTLPTNRCV